MTFNLIKHIVILAIFLNLCVGVTAGFNDRFDVLACNMLAIQAIINLPHTIRRMVKQRQQDAEEAEIDKLKQDFLDKINNIETKTNEALIQKPIQLLRMYLHGKMLSFNPEFFEGPGIKNLSFAKAISLMKNDLQIANALIHSLYPDTKEKGHWYFILNDTKQGILKIEFGEPILV